MSRNENLIKVEQKESLSGFKNLFLMEVSELWKSRTWIWLTLLWVGIIDGITALTVIGVSEPEPNLGIAMFTLFACFFPAIAIIIILQESIVGEKRSGTAEWILSKPISRESFVLSKFFAKSININISMVLIPGI
ncbi:MAG: ABC transporter permease subunit, partial [Candidatus Lokiarchaeota archaeon]